MSQISYTELLAAITGLIGVWLTTKQNIWCWPIAFINIVTSLYVFFFAKLYQDALLQIFYLVLTLYGWYNWLYGGQDKKELSIEKIKRKHLYIYIIAGIIASLVSGYLFKKYTDAALPYWDSVSLVWGIIGTVWMAKKWIEHWIIWVFVDIMCTCIYIYKDLYFFTIQYFIFTLLAIYGYYEWEKSIKIQ